MHPTACLHPDDQGQAMTELLLVMLVLPFLILGAIQIALIFQAKITLNYAAFEAARAGSLDHGSFEAVKEGFARGLAPLYAYTDTVGNKRPYVYQVRAFKAARKKVFNEFDRDLVRIERLNPRDEHFRLFAGKDSTIPNDNLRYRWSGHRSRGDDPRALSIQNANLFHIRVTYWYPLYVPLVNTLIYKVVCTGQVDDNDIPHPSRWGDDVICYRGEPRIPLTATAALRMQTPVRQSTEYAERQLVPYHR